VARRQVTNECLHTHESRLTSESVTEARTNKVAHQISDGVLDAVLASDPSGRLACETLANTVTHPARLVETHR
jgi:S-adenosylmethionine synthetase